MLPILTLAAAAVVSTQQTAEVFAPGVVSIEGDNIYRGSFNPDESEFYFFRKVTEGQEDYRIYVSRRGPDGRWSRQERVNLGGEYSDMYPTISSDGNRMVFSSYRPVPRVDDHNANLYYVDRGSDGTWGTPVLMRDASTFDQYDAGPSFQADGSIKWTSVSADWRTRYPRITRWEGDRYSTHMPVDDPLLERFQGWSPDHFVWGVTHHPSGELVLLDVSEVVNGRRLPGDIWASRLINGEWSEPCKLGAGTNAPDVYDNFTFFSRDGDTLYFDRDFSTYYRVSVEAALHDCR